MNELNSLISQLLQDPAKKAELATLGQASGVFNKPFVPQPKQAEAYFSKADIVLYGGAVGGGKTALGCGLALNEHKRSLIVRKQFADLEAVTSCLKNITAGKNIGKIRGEGNRPEFLFHNDDKRIIHMMGMGDFAGKQGQPHDLVFVDEAAQNNEEDVRLLLGWLRTTDHNQRCRVLLASNPPMDSTGDWLIEWFAPWLDDKHPNPAEQGELRYYLPEGKGFVECEISDSIMIAGEIVNPQSRTFISAKITDNEHINSAEYMRTLANLPESKREMLISGNFMLARNDPIDQCIPTNWVRAAMDRWKPTPPNNVPMCCVGVDVAQGGSDDCVISRRYDWWFDELIRIAGVDCPDGATLAAQILARRRNNSPVVLDLGGGYGGSAYEILKSNGVEVFGHKGANKSNSRTADRQHPFANMRSQVYWLLREALNPEQDGGSILCLPPDNMLLADLTAPSYTITHRGVVVEPKEKVVERLKRSPDAGDAVTIAYSRGLKQENINGGWQDYKKNRQNNVPRVNMGRDNMRKR